MEQIFLPVAAIGGMGLIFGALLAVAAKLFAVEKDERIPQIIEVLPGANCGGCGYAGCSAYAEAVVSGDANVSCCSVGGNAVAEKIGEIMGVKAEKRERMTAFVACIGDNSSAKNRYICNDKIDCRTASRLGGGMKVCAFGCLGCGSCVSKCNFGALSIINGVAKVDRELCADCGACISECPRGVIKRVPYTASTFISCTSTAHGKIVRSVCEKGCIGCGICAKNCPEGAIEMKDNLAVIDFSKCTACGLCSEKCPRGIIGFNKYEEPKIQIARSAASLRGNE